MFDAANMLTLLPSFALVLTRISGIMLGAPIFSSSAVPARVKIGLTVLIALVVFPLILPSMEGVPDTLFGVIVGAGGELLIGLTIGLAVNLLFTGFQLGAHMIAQQMGLGLARVYNPAVEEESGILEQFYMLVAIAMLLLFNGHHLVIRGVLDSFDVLPPMTLTLRPELLHVLRGLLASSYVLALKAAVPAVVILFLVTLMMGFLGRTVPQINILVVGFPLRIGVGLVALAASFGAAVLVFSEGYQHTVDAVAEMMRHLGP